jgi:hypothetical protein
LSARGCFDAPQRGGGAAAQHQQPQLPLETEFINFVTILYRFLVLLFLWLLMDAAADVALYRDILRKI